MYSLLIGYLSLLMRVSSLSFIGLRSGIIRRKEEKEWFMEAQRRRIA